MNDSPVPARAVLPDLSGALRTHLFTTRGTMLFVDPASGELRHGPIDSSPANAVFVADPSSDETNRDGWLMHDTVGGLQPVVCLAENAWSYATATVGAAPITPTRLKLIPLKRGLVALRASDRYARVGMSAPQYLCAEADGRLHLNRTWCSTWEWFLASEDWCTAPLGMEPNRARDDIALNINWESVAEYTVEPIASRAEMGKVAEPMNDIPIGPDAILPDCACRARTRLSTSWGTVVYVDVGSGELRHGPVDRSPANAIFASDGAAGQIIQEIAGSSRPIACGADRCRAVDRASDANGTAAKFEPVPLNERWIGLKADGLLLCAEPDGRITLSRKACSAWESFLPADPLSSSEECAPAVQFARRRVIVMRHRGNIANKLLQYMGA
ncbi:MAG: hypothetical protein JOZ17_23110, partial [Acetobacteraceae bacterium]|nr:hypothetical protein [Acetobacteraceae bacterium]